MLKAQKGDLAHFGSDVMVSADKSLAGPIIEFSSWPEVNKVVPASSNVSALKTDIMSQQYHTH